MKSIYDRLAALADRFLTAAEIATNPKTALSSLAVVEKSMDLLERLTDAGTNASAKIFISYLNLDASYLRSEVWQCYVDFCSVAKLNQVSKSEFYTLLSKLGFESMKTSGEIRLYPPKSVPSLGHFPEIDFEPNLTEYPTIRRRGR
jgi:hypothetical protein